MTMNFESFDGIYVHLGLWMLETEHCSRIAAVMDIRCLGQNTMQKRWPMLAARFIFDTHRWPI